DLFGSEPFDAAGETETAIDTGKTAKPVAQERPGAAARGEALVIVGFTVMNQNADTLTLFEIVIEVTGDVPRRKVLEQFRVGPLHAALSEERFRGFPRAAEAFEQENRFGKFVLHPRDDVFPGRGRHFVAGIAAEAVHAAPAPCQKHFSQGVPKRDIVVLQLDEIFPDSSPGAGAGE